MQKNNKFAPLVLASMIGIFSSNLWADDVRINVNGEITAMTCSVKNSGDRTINLDPYRIDQVVNLPRGVIGGSRKEELIEVLCPAAHGIVVNMTDTGNAASPAGREYLENVAVANNRARNVATQVWLLNSSNRAVHSLGYVPVKTDIRLRNRNNAGNFTEEATETYKLNAYYFLTDAGSTVSPGLVKSTMTLSFTYD